MTLVKLTFTISTARFFFGKKKRKKKTQNGPVEAGMGDAVHSVGVTQGRLAGCPRKLGSMDYNPNISHFQVAATQMFSLFSPRTLGK